MRSIALILPFVLVACAPPLWVKPGGSQNDFSSDKYTCLQQSQQREAGASFNKYGFYAADKVVTNEGLFASCMNSRGWYLQGEEQIKATQSVQQVKVEEAKATVEQLKNETQLLCEKREYKAIFDKAACKASDITLEQLSNVERISKSDKPLFMALFSEQKEIAKRTVHTLRSTTNLKDRDIADLLERTLARREQAALELYEGASTWGHYNKGRKASSEAFQEAMKEINRK